MNHTENEITLPLEISALAESDVTTSPESQGGTTQPTQHPDTKQRLPNIPGYIFESELGRGGMGVVYLARQLRPNRLVAIKMLLQADHANSETRLRFLTEAEAIAKLKHPGIVQVHEIGTHDSNPYFVLEYISGGGLDKKLAGNPLPAAEAAALVEKLARAVQAAHDQDMIHRDLKPANILLSDDLHAPGGSSHKHLQFASRLTYSPKITDFGLVKSMGNEMTVTGQIMGTPSYMAPEQADAKKEIGAAVDIYALGAILYECLTGRAPFKAATPLETLMQVRNQEPVSIRQLQAKTPMDLETICLKCLQKEPGKRYATAGDLADDLVKFMNGDPIAARPIGRFERGWRWCRRYPAAAGLLFVTGCAAVISSGLAAFALKSQSITALALEDVELARSQAVKARDEKQQESVRARENERLANVQRDEAEKQRLRAETNEKQAKAERDETEKQRKRAELNEKQAREERDETEKQRKRAELNEMKAREERDETEKQRKRAETNEKLAKEERDRNFEEKQIAQSILNFLQYKLLAQGNVTSQADFLLSQGRSASETEQDPRISVLLNRAALELAPDKIENNFPKQPRVQAELLTTVGDTYSAIGDYQAAIKYLDRARELQTKLQSVDSTENQALRKKLALANQMAGKLAVAIKLFQQLLDASAKQVGATHPDTLKLQVQLANALRDSGKVAESVTMLAEAHRALVKLLGSEHADCLATSLSLASAYEASGKSSEAVAILEKVEKTLIAQLGEEHPKTLNTSANLGFCYLNAGRTQDAIAKLDRVKETFTRKLGAEHPYTLSATQGLATAYQAAGKVKEAVSLLEHVRDVFIRKLGAEHPNTLSTLVTLGSAYQAAKSNAEAMKAYEQVLSCMERVQFQHKYADRIMTKTLAGLESLPELSKAEQGRRQWLTHLQSVQGKEDPLVANELELLGINLFQQKKWTEAESALRECLVIREKNDARSWPTFYTSSLIGTTLLAQLKAKDAEPFLVKAYTGMKSLDKQWTANNRATVLQTLDYLILANKSLQNADEVNKWTVEKEKLSDQSKSIPNK